ncbi:type III secretion system chaperone YscW, partial [Vibrio agarivorans]
FFSFVIQGCTQVIPMSSGFSNALQSDISGWISADGYIPPVSTVVQVEVCAMIENQCLTVSKQDYKGMQLPVHYSILLSPVQAGNGQMKVKATLISSGEILAIKEEPYVFSPGGTNKNIAFDII